MAKYRARSCPQCNYYVGFSVAKPRFKAGELAVTSFCLNCSYQLPVRAVMRGIQRAASPLRRRNLRLTHASKRPPAVEPQPPLRCAAVSPGAVSAGYARHLRAIGQDLERLRIMKFNLERCQDGYLVWTQPAAHPLSRLSRTRLKKLWKNKVPPAIPAGEAVFDPSVASDQKRLRYSFRDLEWMERDGRNRRRHKSAITDGHSLSQLLRTIGALVEERGEQLLAISWQEFSVCTVVQNAREKREIDIFRPGTLYDLWVRMYLRRNDRVFSDPPS